MNPTPTPNESDRELKAVAKALTVHLLWSMSGLNASTPTERKAKKRSRSAAYN